MQTDNGLKLKRRTLAVGVFALVVMSILILDPTLRPDWLSQFIETNPKESNIVGTSGDATETNTSSRSGELGLIDQGIAPRIGEPVADFALRDLSGDIVHLSDYIGEKLIVLNFWATWCSPCVVEMPDLDEIYRNHRDELVVLGVNIQESRDVVAKFLQNDVDVSYPILFDSEGLVTLGYNIFAQPTTMFIDMDGNLAPINKLPGKFGAFTQEELQQRIEEFINQTSESESTSSR